MLKEPKPQTYSQGLFISIEGIDGSGKSTLINELKQTHSFLGRPLVIVDKNVAIGSDYIEQHTNGLRNLLWLEKNQQNRNTISDLHWLCLAASWFILLEQHIIAPNLLEGKSVVVDSWYAKLLARFLLKDKNVAEYSKSIFCMLEKPTLTILLDVDPILAATRKKSFGYSECGNFDGLEGNTKENFIEYQSKVRRSYKELAIEENWITVAYPDISINTLVREASSRLGALI